MSKGLSGSPFLSSQRLAHCPQAAEHSGRSGSSGLVSPLWVHNCKLMCSWLWGISPSLGFQQAGSGLEPGVCWGGAVTQEHASAPSSAQGSLQDAPGKAARPRHVGAGAPTRRRLCQALGIPGTADDTFTQRATVKSLCSSQAQEKEGLFVLFPAEPPSLRSTQEMLANRPRAVVRTR